MINQCKNFVLSEEITLENDILIVKIPETELTNGLTRIILLNQNVPEIDTTNPPTVSINTAEVSTNTVIQTRTCCFMGVPNNLYADQLKLKCDGQVATEQLIEVKWADDTKCWNYVGPCSRLRKSKAVI